jgi:nitric oxide reductase subunit B
LTDPSGISNRCSKSKSVLFGFAILGYLAYRIYEDHPPVPGRVVSDKGETVFTGDEIRQGQGLVLWIGVS